MHDQEEPPHPHRWRWRMALAGAILAAGAVGLYAAALSGSTGGGRGSARPSPTAATPTTTDPTGPPTGPMPPHVVVVVMENREFDDVIGSRDAPYVNTLAAGAALATNMTAVTHPSLPNYIAMVSGDTFGIADDGEDHVLEGPLLATQLDEAGYSWAAYLEGLPPDPTAPCTFPSGGDGYVKKHNPFAYFTQVQQDDARCARIVPLSSFDPASLPDVSWIVPDQCHDGHDCPTEEADAWLAGFVPGVLEAMSDRDLLVLTWDEGTTGEGGGGRIVTVFAGPGAAVAGTQDPTPYTTYSLLRTIEDLFDLPPLRHAGDPGVEPMTGMLAEANRA